MKILKLYEEYINSAPQRIREKLLELQERMEGWFAEGGELAAENLDFGDCTVSKDEDFSEKNIILNFTDQTNKRFRLTVVIKIEDVKGNEDIKKAYLKLVVLSPDEQEPDRLRTRPQSENLEDLDRDLTPDKIITKIGELIDVKPGEPLPNKMDTGEAQTQTQSQPPAQGGTQPQGGMEF